MLDYHVLLDTKRQALLYEVQQDRLAAQLPRRGTRRILAEGCLRPCAGCFSQVNRVPARSRQPDLAMRESILASQ